MTIYKDGNNSKQHGCKHIFHKPKILFVSTIFDHNHIDRAPLGDIEDTIIILVLNEKDIDIYYKHTYNNEVYVFDTREVKKVLEGIPFTDYNVIAWIKNNIKEGIKTILKEESR